MQLLLPDRSSVAACRCRNAPRPWLLRYQQPPAQCSVRQQQRRARQRKLPPCSASSGIDTSTKQLKETAALDQLIDVLQGAKSKKQLAQLAAENFLSFDKRFWLRLAARSDTASSPGEKQRLATLASSVMTLIDGMVHESQGQLQQSSSALEQIMTAAADERGEWHLPLSGEQLKAMREAMDAREDQLNESLLANAFAYMRKATNDGLDGVVALLQQMLQLYAAKVLVTPGAGGVDAALNEIIGAPEAQWGGIITQQLADGRLQRDAALEALQKRMEGLVLGQNSGSYAQRVQAEYLKEVQQRIEMVTKNDTNS